MIAWKVIGSASGCAGYVHRRQGVWPVSGFMTMRARAAILIDLVFWRRLSRASTGALVISTTPTSNAVADRMLTNFDQHPDTTIRDVLAKGPGRLVHFADDAGPHHRWRSRRPRIPEHEVADERHRLERAAARDLDSPRTPAPAILADPLQLITLSQPENVLGECGNAAWIGRAAHARAHVALDQ